MYIRSPYYKIVCVIYIGAIYLYHVRNRVSGQVIQTPYLGSKFQVSLIVNT